MFEEFRFRTLVVQVFFIEINELYQIVSYLDHNQVEFNKRSEKIAHKILNRPEIENEDSFLAELISRDQRIED